MDVLHISPSLQSIYFANRDRKIIAKYLKSTLSNEKKRLDLVLSPPFGLECINDVVLSSLKKYPPHCEEQSHPRTGSPTWGVQFCLSLTLQTIVVPICYFEELSGSLLHRTVGLYGHTWPDPGGGIRVGHFLSGICLVR